MRVRRSWVPSTSRPCVLSSAPLPTWRLRMEDLKARKEATERLAREAAGEQAPEAAAAEAFEQPEAAVAKRRRLTQ